MHPLRQPGLFFSFFFFLTSVASLAVPPCKTAPDGGLSSYLVSEQGTSQPAINELLAVFAIAKPATFASTAKILAERWARAPGVERWQIKEVYDDKRAALSPLMEQLGMTCEKRATKLSYDYALLLGSVVGRVRSRIAFLAEEWKRGVHFSKVVMLGAQRELDPVQDSRASLLDTAAPELPARMGWKFSGKYPTTEIEMMKLLWEQADLPTGMRKVPLWLVDTPNKKLDGKAVRAETVDTIVYWMKQHPRPGSCLMVSSQPFTGYQHEVVLPAFLPGFTVETVGSGAAVESLKLGVALDNLAQWALRINARK